MGLISRVSSRTYRKQETESLKWPSPKLPNPEFQKASPKNEHDSRNRLPPKPKQNSLPKKPTWSNDEKSSKKPENTLPNMPPKLRPSLTIPKPQNPTAIT